jgi:hypothetical protein
MRRKVTNPSTVRGTANKDRFPAIIAQPVFSPQQSRYQGIAPSLRDLLRRDEEVFLAMTVFGI